MDVRNSDAEHAIAVAILSAFSAILQGTAIQSVSQNYYSQSLPNKNKGQIRKVSALNWTRRGKQAIRGTDARKYVF
jgi:hypothetical protein